MTNSIVAGRNAVKEALRSGSDINKIYVQDSINKNQVKELLDLARKQKVIVQNVPKSKIDGMKMKSTRESSRQSVPMNIWILINSFRPKKVRTLKMSSYWTGLKIPIILVRY